GGVVDLEDGAGVVAQAAREAEIEDHALGGRRREQVAHAPDPRDGVRDRPWGRVEHVRSAPHLWHAQQQVDRVVAQLEPDELVLEPDEVALVELVHHTLVRFRWYS